MKRIPLTKGLFALVDDSDFEYLNQFKWHIKKDNKDNTAYAARVINSNGKIYMHREILNAPADKKADHIDGNGLNNQRINLRLCSSNENSRNARLFKTSTSGYKGVHYVAGWKESSPRKKPWRAEIFYKKNVVLGYFTTPVEAALAYNEAAKKYFGEFARLNVIL